MSETEFEKWLAMKSGKRKKQMGRENLKELSTRKKKASISKLAKQPIKDQMVIVKHLIAQSKQKSAENIIAYHDPNILKMIVMNYGIVVILVTIVIEKLLHQKMTMIFENEDILNLWL